MTHSYWIFVHTGFAGLASKWVFSIVSTHGISWMLIYIDFLLSAERMYYKSVFWPVLLGILFTFWTLIFEAAGWKNEAGQPYVYSSYDWSASAMPLVFFFLSIVFLTAFSALATFIKNMILMKSDIGPKMIAICKETTGERNGTTYTKEMVVEI